jgi:PIN domain nuclease of toxin-antitoxin system
MTKLLLDTNVFLLISEGTVPKEADKIIQNSVESCYFTTASLWELVIKDMLGKIRMKERPDAIMEQFVRSGYKRLDIKVQHITQLHSLPALHKDPFDRIIVAQAKAENMSLLTTDEALKGYGDEILFCKKS